MSYVNESRRRTQRLAAAGPCFCLGQTSRWCCFGVRMGSVYGLLATRAARQLASHRCLEPLWRAIDRVSFTRWPAMSSCSFTLLDLEQEQEVRKAPQQGPQQGQQPQEQLRRRRRGVGEDTVRCGWTVLVWTASRRRCLQSQGRSVCGGTSTDPMVQHSKLCCSLLLETVAGVAVGALWL